MRQETSIEVLEYVAPIFSISFEAPEYILRSDDSLNFTTKVAYIFKKPVSGTLFYKFGILVENKVMFIGSSNTFSFVGEHKYTFFLNEIKSLYPTIHDDSRFVIEAVVSDNSTSIKDKAHYDNILLVRQPFKISLLSTLLYYRPNISNYVSVCSLRFWHSFFEYNFRFSSLRLSTRLVSQFPMYPS